MEEVIKIANENASASPGEDITSAEKYFQVLIEKDNKIQKIFEEEEKLILEEQKLVKQLKDEQLKSTVQTFYDSLEDYIISTKNNFLVWKI
ncbi:hypothetical protein [Carboxydothermus islandicus]|uniref:hypothetical protein n=1 Tax=Carboxydothermus islandicus TaxID=661089 RepID=UPI001177DB6B|nr:hypothetical protein [Carboxydothermus islandicus]